MDHSEINTLFEKAASEHRLELNKGEVFAILAGIFNDDIPTAEDETLIQQPDPGHDLMVQIANSREFGMILTAGSGGPDTELYASSFKQGAGFVSASAEMTDGKEFLDLFKKTFAYKKISLDDGTGDKLTDAALIHCFDACINLARQFAPSNIDTTHIIEELIVNPITIHKGRLVPLAGQCKMGQRIEAPAPRPIHKINNLLHPGSIGIIGVSATKMNFGRIILKNIIASGYDKEKLVVIKPGEDETVDDVRIVQDLASLDNKLDLFVVAVGADVVLNGLAEEIIKTNAAETVMLIPGGLGETEASREPVADMIARINEAHKTEDGGPIFIGGNCLGVVSHPGNYDTWFIPQELLPKPQKKASRNSALISQSGAFMITRLSKNPWIDPAYMAALGNQNDITHSDMTNYFAEMDGIDVIGLYIEGFKEMDGLAFARAVKKATRNNKLVIVYKAGQTQAGSNATMGHTASIAGDYEVCETVLTQAGAIVTQEFNEFADLFYIAGALGDKKISGNRLGGVSGAGFETVGIADSTLTEKGELQIAQLEDASMERLGNILKEKRLDALMEIRNPFDINPGADDETHLLCAEVMADDPNVDVVVVGLDPLSPMTRTLEKSAREGHDIHNEASLANTLPPLAKKLEKPIIGILEGGTLFDPFAEKLMDQGVCVFRHTERAVKALAKYIHGKLRASEISDSAS